MHVEDNYFDQNRNKIEEGDLLEIYHFIGARKRKYFMYHVVTLQEWPEGKYWGARNYNKEKSHYNLKAVANAERIIKGTRIIAKEKWDAKWKK